MINFVNKNIMDANENYIIVPVDCAEMPTGLINAFIDKYPHIEKEYSKFYTKSVKDRFELLGMHQFIPVDDWALGLFGGSTGEFYDKKQYQYIVNVFCMDNSSDKNPFQGKRGKNADIMSLTNALTNIKAEAEKNGASIAVQYDMCKYAWGSILSVLKKLFADSDINVIVYKKK